MLVAFPAPIPPAPLFVLSDPDLFPTPLPTVTRSGVDTCPSWDNQGICRANLKLRLKGAGWVRWSFERMGNKAQVYQILRRVGNASPTERKREKAWEREREREPEKERAREPAFRPVGALFLVQVLVSW